MDDSIFGLPANEVHAIVERAVGCTIASLSTHFRHAITGHPGYQGAKLVPTFEYVTPDGAAGNIVMFVKKHDEPDRIESEQFRQIETHGALVPRMHGALRDADGREVLFLEHVDRVYRDDEVYASSELLGRFVRLIAQLNSVRIEADYQALPHHGGVHPLPAKQVDTVPRIGESARGGKLGDGLAELFAGDPELVRRVIDRLRRLSELTAAYPRGFVHGDLWPHHVGSREGSEQMLALDLGYSLHATRFFDIAPFIGPTDDLPPLALSREDIAACYLDEYRAPDGNAVTNRELLVEADTVWLAWNSRRLTPLCERAAAGDNAGRGTLAWLLERLGGRDG